MVCCSFPNAESYIVEKDIHELAGLSLHIGDSRHCEICHSQNNIWIYNRSLYGHGAAYTHNFNVLE